MLLLLLQEVIPLSLNCAFRGHTPPKSQLESCNFQQQTAVSAHETIVAVPNTLCSNAFRANPISTPTSCTPSPDQEHSTSITPPPNWPLLFSNPPPVHQLKEVSFSYL